MSLEAGTYVSDLVQANPPGSDDRSQADDHMRLIKSVLKNTFPNSSKAFRFPTTALEAAGTVTVAFPSDQNKVFPVTAAAAARTVSLPDPSLGGTVNEDGFSIVVFKTDSSGNAVNVTASGSQTVNGTATLALQRQWDYALLWWSKDNAEWYAVTSVSAGSVIFGSSLTPAVISADQNDYAPTGHETAFEFRLEASGAFRTITGLAGGAPGRVIMISNVATFDLVFPHESASSAAANRFSIQGGTASSLVIGSGEAMLFRYDSTVSRWRPMAVADLDLQIAGAMSLAQYLEMAENTPANPIATRIRGYAVASGGTTKLAYRDSAGTEHVLETVMAGALLGVLEDNQTSGTEGASLPASSTTTRTLNTEVYDRLGILSLASNQFTISTAGTYEIEWDAPVGGTGNDGFHQSILRDVTAGADVKRGTSGRLDNGDTGVGGGYSSKGVAVVTIAASNVYEIRHTLGAYTGGSGITQGDAASLGTEVYTRVTIRKA